MSVYFIKGKGWRYEFILNGLRYTKAWFKTKTEAKQAQAQRKEEIKNPKSEEQEEETPTDMVFLELVNKRLDYVQAFRSDEHYHTYLYLAKR